MGDALSYVIGPLIAALSIRLFPTRRLGQAAILWTVGLFLARVVPALAGVLMSRIPAPFEWEAWLGGICMLRATWFLVTYERPRGRGFRAARACFALAFLLPVLTPRYAAAFLPLALPMIWSFRWRKGLGARSLVLVTAGALASVLVAASQLTSDVRATGGMLPGIRAFTQQATMLAAVYALLVFPVVAARIHLSIRNIGRRLVGSHLLAAVIPFVLGVAFLLGAGGFFLATYRGSVSVRMLVQQSESARERLSSYLADGMGTHPEPFGEGPRRQIVIAREGNEPARILGAFDKESLGFSPDSLLAHDEPSTQTPLLWDGHNLYLRARWDGVRNDPRLGAVPVRVEALAEVDSLWMNRISVVLGVPTRILPRTSVGRQSNTVQIGSEAEETSPVAKGAEETNPVAKGAEGDTTGDGDVVIFPGHTDSTRGQASSAIGPKDGPGLRLPGGATVECLRASPTGWSHRTIPISSSASFAENLSFFWSVSRENPIAFMVLLALAFIAFLFLAAIGVATGMVLEMGRSVTRAVHALTEGTRALREGRLEHRIAVEGHDELWDVAGSFNEMAGNLQETRVRELAAQRMEEELRLARTIQDRLLPSGPPALERMELAGMSLPAREVGGDYYDYLLLDDGRLGIAVADVSGKGTPAALLMSAFRAALRSQDLGALGPAEVLARINRFICESVDPGKFITAFLALIDPATGEIRYANAGHDAPMVVSRAGVISELTGGGLILGLLPQIVYDEAVATMETGALFAVFTDGVTEARGENEEFYGTERMAGVFQRYLGSPCSEVLHHLTEDIAVFSGAGPQSDDITVIMARRR